MTPPTPDAHTRRRGPGSPQAPGPGALEANALEPNALEADALEPDALEANALEPNALEADALEPNALEADALEPDAPAAGPVEPDGPELAERFGLCQWFHHHDHRLLEATVAALDDLNVRHLRTGISWADYHRPAGHEWYDHLMEVLAHSGLQVLLSVWHTPPSISADPARGSASIPPARPRDLADFLDLVIDRYGHAFHTLEIWNEPNNPYKWDRRYDPDYRTFARMAIDAGHWARVRGRTTVLGGLTLLDYEFVRTMGDLGVLDHVDILGVHAFPGMWEPFATSWEAADHWFGWPHRVQEMERESGLPVWITETGLATYHKGEDRVCREDRQVARLGEALQAPAERVYWYTLFDLPPDRPALEELRGGPREEAEYHMGLVRYAPGFPVRGLEKPAYFTLRRALTPAHPATSR
jgi:CDP-paratose 2-epimerase